jgi:hypothetical protein
MAAGNKGSGASRTPLDGFVPLFNGVDFAGWKDPYPGRNVWKVAGGIIEGHETGQAAGGGVLLTERSDYGDFILRITARYVQKGRGQIEIRHTGADDTTSGCHISHGGAGGQEVPIGSIGRPLDSRYLGRNDWYRKAQWVPLPVDEWYTIEINAVRNHIKITLNEHPVLDFVDPTQTHASGGIAMLIGHTSHIQIREILIRELSRNDDQKAAAQRKTAKKKRARAKNAK